MNGSLDCEPFLGSIDMGLLEPTSHLLLGVGKLSISICTRLAAKVLPLFLERVQRTDGKGDRVAEVYFTPLIADWTQTIAATNQIHVSAKELNYLWTPLKSLVLGNFSHSMQPRVVAAGFRIADALLRMNQDPSNPNHWTDDQRLTLAQLIQKTFVCFQNSETELRYDLNIRIAASTVWMNRFFLRSSCMKCMRTLSKLSWPLVRDQVVPNLIKDCKLSIIDY